MTPEKTAIIKSLIAFAWADGRVTPEEEDIVDALLVAVEATPEEKAELHEYAKVKRDLDDIPVAGLSGDQREVLLTNAAILVRADGEESASESSLLRVLGAKLELTDEQFSRIVAASEDNALQLPTDSLIALPPSRRRPTS